MAENIENIGGEGGGERLILKRSELAILRRMADKYPIVPEERREILDMVMDTARTMTSSPKTQLAAAKVIVAMDRLNHDELKLYLEATRAIGSDLQPAQTIINNQVVVQNNVEQALQEPAYLEYLREKRLERDSDAGPVCGGSEPGPVEDGSPLNGHRSGTNGQHKP